MIFKRKRNWIYKGVGQTQMLFCGKVWVHVWECSITNNKIKTDKIK